MTVLNICVLYFTAYGIDLDNPKEGGGTALYILYPGSNTVSIYDLYTHVVYMYADLPNVLLCNVTQEEGNAITVETGILYRTVKTITIETQALEARLRNYDN